MANVDPRFDPRFQRGYAGEVDAPPAAPASPRPVAPPPVALSRFAAPHIEPPSFDPPLREPESPGASPHTSAVPADAAVDDAELDPELVDVAGARARGILLGLAIALPLVAIVLLVSQFVIPQEIYFQERNPLDLARELARQYLPSPLVLGGIVALLGWIVAGGTRRHHE